MPEESIALPALSPEINEQIVDFIREYIECPTNQRADLEKDIIFQDQIIANISIGELKGRPVINTRVGSEAITVFTTQIDEIEKQVRIKGWQCLAEIEQPGDILGPYELIIDEIENINSTALIPFDPDLKPLLEEYQTKDITEIPVKIPPFRLMQIKFNRNQKREMVYIFNQDIPPPPEGFTEEELKRINGKVKYNTLTVTKETPYCGLDYSNKDKPNSQSYLQELTLYANKKKIEPGMTQIEKDEVTLYNQVSESASRKIKNFTGPIMKDTVNGAQKGDIFGITNDVIYSNIGYYLFDRAGDDPIITFTYHDKPIVDLKVYGRDRWNGFVYMSYPLSWISTKDRNGTRDRLSSRYTWPVSEIKKHRIPAEQKQHYLNRPLTPPIVPQEVLDDQRNLLPFTFSIWNPNTTLYQIAHGINPQPYVSEELELAPYLMDKIVDILYAKMDGKNISPENCSLFARVYKIGLSKPVHPDWNTDPIILNTEIREFEKYLKRWLKYQEEKGRGIDYIAVKYDNILNTIKQREYDKYESRWENEVNENLQKRFKIDTPTTTLTQRTIIRYTKEQLDEFSALVIKEYKNGSSGKSDLSTEELDKMKKYYKEISGYDMENQRVTQRVINDINRFNKQLKKHCTRNPQKLYLLEYFRNNKEWMNISAEVDAKASEVIMSKNPVINISRDSITLQDAESLIDYLNIELRRLILSSEREEFIKKQDKRVDNFSSQQKEQVEKFDNELKKITLSTEQNEAIKKLYMAFSRTPLINGWGNYLAEEIISLQISLPDWLNEQVKKGKLKENSDLHIKWHSLKEKALKFRQEKTIKANKSIKRM